MGSKVDLVKEFQDAAWSNPPSSVKEASTKYFSDDFKSLNKDGQVEMDKTSYIGMSQVLMASFEGFKWVRSSLREAEDGVIMTGHFEGTHTGNLDLSAMGLGVIPASGKKIVWPEAEIMWKVKDNKIVSLKPLGDGGGMGAFLAQLGVKIPKA